MKQLLIVDDDKNLIMQLMKDFIICLQNFQSDFCFTVEDCIEKVKAKHYDVILLDIQFKKKKLGLDAIEKIHEIDPNVNIITFSNFDDHITIKTALNKRAADFVSKSNSSAEIAFRIEQTLTREEKKLQMLRE